MGKIPKEAGARAAICYDCGRFMHGADPFSSALFEPSRFLAFRVADDAAALPPLIRRAAVFKRDKPYPCLYICRIRDHCPADGLGAYATAFHC
ncbi:hypothetical protein SDC9_58593 [bioreactor metagenome]|uniref:Uncharacterized protein n=1 Tax=bioreactor metagenome TaxID=1076179 RepID=A0A644X8V0_9ZZZZ